MNREERNSKRKGRAPNGVVRCKDDERRVDVGAGVEEGELRIGTEKEECKRTNDDEIR